MQGAPWWQLSCCTRPGIVRMRGHGGVQRAAPYAPLQREGPWSPLHPSFEQRWAVLHTTMYKVASDQAGGEMRDAEPRGTEAGPLPLIRERHQHKQGICLSVNKLGVTVLGRNRGGEDVSWRSAGTCPITGLLGRMRGHRGCTGQTGMAEVG